jgi:hypothetical protein
MADLVFCSSLEVRLGLGWTGGRKGTGQDKQVI